MQLTLYKRCTIKKEINKCSKFFVAQKAVVSVLRGYWSVVVCVSQDMFVLISGPVCINAFSIVKAHISRPVTRIIFGGGGGGVVC